MIIGVTGTNGSGKGTAVDYLVSKGFTHYSVRKELEEELKRRGSPIDRPHMGSLGNELRAKNGAGYFCRLFIDRAKADGIRDVVIESIRSKGEAAVLHELGGMLLAVDADTKRRYERTTLRGSSTDKIDFDTWVAQEQKEWNNAATHDMDVPGVMRLADYTIRNDGTLQGLHASIDAVLSSLGG